MAKKTTAKSAAKTTKAKTAKSPVKAKKATNTKPLTKTQIIQEMADSTQMTKVQVSDFFDHLNALIEGQLKKGGPGKITLPIGVKLELKDVPARPARPGRDPRTGEMVTFKAKPASRTIKARAMKQLTEIAGKK